MKEAWHKLENDKKDNLIGNLSRGLPAPSGISYQPGHHCPSRTIEEEPLLTPHFRVPAHWSIYSFVTFIKSWAEELLYVSLTLIQSRV